MMGMLPGQKERNKEREKGNPGFSWFVLCGYLLSFLTQVVFIERGFFQLGKYACIVTSLLSWMDRTAHG